jgi:hypothetical protein
MQKNYGSWFIYLDNKNVHMKRHVYHNLLYDFLPIAVRDALNEKLLSIVYCLREFFCWICSKEIKESEIDGIKIMVAKLMCGMERNLSRSFLTFEYT